MGKKIDDNNKDSQNKDNLETGQAENVDKDTNKKNEKNEGEKFMLIDKPFVIKEGKSKDFLDAFVSIPSLPKDYLEDCEKVAKESRRLEKEWKKKK